jgi:acyl-CoA synthetase (AMP-forming)/AMP-acid ligase II
VDRKTDMVISGGENIYCAEVEQILGRHPDILAIGTFGVPDDRLGERLVASARIKEGASAEDILAFAKENLAAYKVPTEITVQTEPFELNAMGKIQKHIIRKAYLTRKMKEQAL